MISDIRDLLWQSKIDHRLRALLARFEGNPEEGTKVANVLVRFSGDLESLRKHGVQINTVAVDIATASIVLTDIQKIASDPQVVFIELSHPLKPDPPLLKEEG
jgi:hypothetical protein